MSVIEGDFYMGILRNANKESFCISFLKFNCDRKKSREVMADCGYQYNRAYFSRLVNDPLIQGRILELQQAAADKAVMGLRERLEMLSKIARDEGQKPSIRMSAVDKIHKQSGDDVAHVTMDKAGDANSTTNVIRMVDLQLPQRNDVKKVEEEVADSASEAAQEIYGEGIKSEKDKKLADELNKLDTMDL